jgi:hypothetical protein
MSVEIKAVLDHRLKLAEIECQMVELICLRRALCLLNAKRNRPPGSRRRRHAGVFCDNAGSKIFAERRAPVL